MISDTLSEAVDEIQRYLEWKDPDGTPFYGDPSTPFRMRLDRLLADMNAMRRYLDTPPSLPASLPD